MDANLSHRGPAAPTGVRHGAYAVIALCLALLFTVIGILLPALNKIFYFPGRLFRDVLMASRAKAGQPFLTGSHLISEVLVNFLVWALLIYATAFLIGRLHAHSPSESAS